MRRGGAVDDLAHLLVELLDAGQSGARHRLVGATRPGGRSPASAWSGCSTGIAAIVVQFGLATIPFGMRSSVLRVHLGTTSGTSGSMRQAEELSITTAPAAAKRGASVAAMPVAPDGEQRESSPAGSAVAASSTTTSSPFHGSVRPAERAEAK